MIAIPNMDKPKNCDECSFFILDGAITDENEWVSYSICDLLDKTIGDADMLNDCPLIDIVTCGECSRRKKNGFCLEHNRYERNDDGFCSYGERRSDGNKRRSV